MQRRSFARAFAVCAAVACAAPAQSPTLLIRGGRVHARPGAEPVEASILVVDGRIKDVGKDVVAPEGAEVLDAAGHEVYPSFIDPLNDALLETYPTPPGALGGGDRALDLYDRFADARRARLIRAGVGVVGLGAPASGMRSGVAAVVCTPVGADGAPTVIAEDRFVQFDVAVRQRAGGDPFSRGLGGSTIVNVMSRDTAVRSLEEFFEGAKKYREAWEKYAKDLEEYRKKLAEGGGAESKPAEKKDDAEERRPAPRGAPRLPEGFRDWPRQKQREWMRENMNRGPGGAETTESSPTAAKSDGKLKPPEKPKVEPEKEALVRVLKREQPLWVAAEWTQDLDAVLDFAKAKKVRLVVIGAAEADLRLEKLKAAKAVVLLPPPVAFGEDPLGGPREDLARLLAKEGIPFAFFTAGRPEYGPDGLPFAAALAIGRGLTEDQALAAVTVNAARALGLEKTLGTVEVGKEAHLMLIKGSPFAPGARPARLVCRGRTVATEN
ncbi:MAG TPA: amidohydrolase family protein [Planctomycetota bacterium]|nr:amidohydrolase family protein [Planctomycetota bacterium]